ncbi:hypothetical protein ACFLZ7_00820 [Nanoarchaeota archaeon]
MALYEILVNKPCVWIIKALYDQETAEKKSYTMSLSVVDQLFGLNGKAAYFALILAKDKLIHLDEAENDKIICLTKKGKEFFKQFDKLKTTIEIEKKEEKKFAKIEYDLTDTEKKTLMMTYRMSRELGEEIPFKNLVQEMYPYDDYSKKSNVVYKHIGKLEKLNLMAKMKKGRSAFVSLTVPGKRTIKEQLIENISQQLN